VLVPPGSDITLGADFAAPPGAELYVRYAALPDQSHHDSAAIAGHLHPRLVLSNTKGGTYYIRLHGREDATGTVPFMLTAAASGFEITAASPLKGSNRGNPAIITLQGARFTPQTQVHLRQAGVVTRSAQSVAFISANKLVATIDLAGLPIGSYELAAEDAGQTVVSFDTFTVTDKDGGRVGASIWVKPSQVIADASTGIAAGLGIRVGARVKLNLAIHNSSDSPLPAPLIQLRATNVETGQETTGSLTIDTVPPDQLPGEFYAEFNPWLTLSPNPRAAGVQTVLDLYIIEPDETPMRAYPPYANRRRRLAWRASSRRRSLHRWPGSACRTDPSRPGFES
jgi:hypothetical protein